jgi:hypothetical protein
VIWPCHSDDDWELTRAPGHCFGQVTARAKSGMSPSVRGLLKSGTARTVLCIEPAVRSRHKKNNTSSSNTARSSIACYILAFIPIHQKSPVPLEVPLEVEIDT